MIANEIVSASNEERVSLLALWRVFWRYKWLIAATAALGAGIALILALTATSIYHAEVVVTEVKESNMSGGNALSTQLGTLAGLAGMNMANGPSREARAILKSRRLVEEFIKRNELVPVISGQGPEQRSLWRAAKRFKDDVLGIREDTRQGLITIAIEWSDAATATRWANGFVALANELIRARELEESTRNVAYLNQQIAATNVVELQRVLYNLIETETKTLMLANARAEYAFTVVDPAVAPEVRVSPRRTIMVLFGIVLGLSAGIVIVLLYSALRGQATKDP